MPYVLNTSDVPLPNKLQLTEEQAMELEGLQKRKHLRAPRRLADKNGQEIVIEKPLNLKERTQLEKLEQIVRDGNMPSVGHLQFPFAPHGQEGCAWEAPIGAQTLVDQHPTRLKIVSRDELQKLKAYPRYHSSQPTLEEWNDPWRNAHGLGTIESDLHTHSAVVKDGQTVEGGPLAQGARR